MADEFLSRPARFAFSHPCLKVTTTFGRPAIGTMARPIRFMGRDTQQIEDFEMKKILQGLCAAALAGSFAVADIVAASAAPLVTPQAPSAVNLVDQVAWRGRGGRDRWEHRNGNVYLHGHRGYRHHRHGYREYNGYWFPLAAFAAGALVTGAINNAQPVYRGSGSAHVQWCYNRYRSYRASDNTFQPYHGPRQQCYSPYN